MSLLTRHNVNVQGVGDRPLMLVNGFGCSQQVWRYVAPALGTDHRVISFDAMGCGGSDLRDYDRATYATLDGHARDLVRLAETMRLERAVLVAHGTGAMIGALAVAMRPALFDALVMVAPNPFRIDDGDYRGGFSAQEIAAQLEELERSYFSWAHRMAPVVMGNPACPQLTAELAEAWCINDPEIARHAAHVALVADNRHVLPGVSAPTLILQCTDDAMSPPAVGAYLLRHLPSARLATLQARGNCPHLSAPAETIAAIRAFLDGRRAPG